MHIVVNNKIHTLLIGNEKHIDHAITINVCKIKDLIILNV